MEYYIKMRSIIGRKCRFSTTLEKKINISKHHFQKSDKKLYEMGVSGFKIGSGECNNYPLIEFISKFKKPITGVV